MTILIKIDPDAIDADKLRTAADIITGGGIVAFPTETVYGLGANAFDTKAVEKIFKAKGRPQDNPLILHISEFEDIGKLTEEIPQIAEKLAAAFWPGPMTLVMKKSRLVPYNATAGLDTVAIRMPAHPVAAALIKLAGVPIAAPSANISGAPSPTNADHVLRDLDGRIDAVIDSGSTHIGLESTVIDITSNRPIILRPGAVTREQVEELTASFIEEDTGEEDAGPLSTGRSDGAPRSPGVKHRHYSPKASLMVIDGKAGKAADVAATIASKFISAGRKTAVMATDETLDMYGGIPDVYSMGARSDPSTIAAGIYSLLRKLDSLEYEVIIAESIEDKGLGAAIMNRLNKASGYNIIKV